MILKRMFFSERPDFSGLHRRLLFFVLQTLQVYIYTHIHDSNLLCNYNLQANIQHGGSYRFTHVRALLLRPGPQDALG